MEENKKIWNGEPQKDLWRQTPNQVWKSKRTMQKSLREKLQKQALNAKAGAVYWIEHNKGKVQLVGHLINHFTLFCLTELLTCLAHVGDNMKI